MPDIDFVKGVPEDYEEIVDFANYVFSHDHCRHDFPLLLPKLYEKGVNTSGCHFLAKKGGKIVAAVGSFPMKASILGREFKVAGIGTVSVHPYYRSLGLMKELMREVIADMRERGVAFSMLGGQRQRYEYYGFEPCGMIYHFSVNSANLRHTYPGRVSAITLRPMKPEDREIIGQSLRLQEKQPFHVVREAGEFYNICRSWAAVPYLFEKDGRFCGYVSCSVDGRQINELMLADTADLSDAFLTMMSFFGIDGVELNLAPVEREMIGMLSSYCERMSINHSENFVIFDYEGLTRALLTLKAQYAELVDGSLTLNIRNYGSLKIDVHSGQVDVAKTQSAADLTVGGLEATRLLFSPFGFCIRVPKGEAARCAASWFPLPLFWPSSDGV